MELLFAIIDRTPSWLRPALIGALLLFAIVAVRMVFALPRLLSHPAEITPLLLALGAASAAGAAGGLAYSLLGAPLRGLRVVGPYLAGVVTVIAYMGALALAAPYAFGEPLIEHRSDVGPFLVISILFGLVMGHSWFRGP